MSFLNPSNRSGFILFLFVFIVSSCGKKDQEPFKYSDIPLQVKGVVPASSSCYSEIRNSILERDFRLGDEDIIEDNIFIEQYSQVNRPIKKIYSLTSTNDEIEKATIHYDFKNSNIDFELYYSEEKLALMITFEIDHKGIQKKHLEKNYLISNDCKLNYTSMNILNITYGEDFKNSSVDMVYHNKLGDFKLETKVIHGEILFSNSKLLEDIVLSPVSIEKTGLYYMSDTLIPVSLKTGGRTKNSVNFKLDITNVLILSATIGFDDKKNITTMSISDPINLTSNVISYNKFKAFKLIRNEKSDLEIELPSGFFTQSDSELSIKTGYVGNFHFLKNYFDLKVVNEKNYTLKLKDNPVMEETSIEVRPLEIDQVYLTGSDFIELDNPRVKELVEIIKNKKLTYRSEILAAVQEIVTTELTYDYEMVENDLTRILGLDEVLKKGKGVCQHFALLSTTLLRALGIPARIIMGYSLSEDKINGHAWIEVKLTNDRWLPVEPQSAYMYEIRNLSYFPVNVMGDYEKGNPLMKDIDSSLEGMIIPYKFSDASTHPSHKEPFHH